MVSFLLEYTRTSKLKKITKCAQRMETNVSDENYFVLYFIVSNISTTN